MIINNSIAETDHERGLTARELKRECFLYAKENFQGKLFRNTDTERDILVSRDGLDKWFNMTKSRDQALSIKRLDVILEECKKTSQKADKKERDFVDEYIYYSHNMTVNGNPYKISLATRVTHKVREKYYYHFLEDIKIEPDSGLA